MNIFEFLSKCLQIKNIIFRIAIQILQKKRYKYRKNIDNKIIITTNL